MIADCPATTRSSPGLSACRPASGWLCGTQFWSSGASATVAFFRSVYSKSGVLRYKKVRVIAKMRANVGARKLLKTLKARHAIAQAMGMPLNLNLKKKKNLSVLLLCPKVRSGPKAERSNSPLIGTPS